MAAGVRYLLLLVRGIGMLLVVIVGISWLVALLLLLLFFPVRFSLIGGLHPILRFGLFLIAAGGNVGLRSLLRVLLYGLLLGCLLLIRVGVPSQLRFRGFWEVFDERLQYMSRHDALLLDASLDSGDVSRAWLVWSGAAEAALADAYRFSGVHIPSRGLVLGRGSALFRVVRLGGHKVKKARGNVSDVDDAAGVFLYRGSSIAPLLDMRRRFSAVLCVLDAMIRWSISLARYVELTSQWDKILAIGPSYPISRCDLAAVWGLGIGEFSWGCFWSSSASLRLHSCGCRTSS